MNDAFELFQVDSFTSEPFRGNPAGVCVLERAVEDGFMQVLAREMNLSETAFLYPISSGSYALRWFTPTLEVDLCGHATLASAHVLWETGREAPDARLGFQTRSGQLSAVQTATGIEMDFPEDAAMHCESPAGLADSLGLAPVAVSKNSSDYLVEVSCEAEVREAKPNFSLLKEVPCRGVMITSRSETPGFDFVSRFFAPQSGIDEDPVTGSAHCALAPYWGTRLGKTEMLGYQASARGGEVGVRWVGRRVILIGRAVTVFRAIWMAG